MLNQYLFITSEKDKPEIYLKNHKCNLNDMNDIYDNTLYTITYNLYKVSYYFIDNYLDINYKKDNLTILHHLIKNNNYELIEYILNKNNISSDLINSLFYYAIKNYKFNLIKLLIKYGADVNILENNVSPLDNAIKYCDLLVVSYLIENNAQIIYNISNNKYFVHNSVITAIKYNKLDILKYFIDVLNINPDCYEYNYYLENYKYSSLMCAIETNNNELIKYLIDKKVNVNYYDNDNICALYLSIKNKNYEITEYLINNGAVCKCFVDMDLKKNVIIYAIMHNDIKTVKLLCENNDYDYNIIFVFVNSIQMVDYLLNHFMNKGFSKDDIINATCYGITNALYNSIINNNTDLFLYLLNNGCNINFISRINNFDNTILSKNNLDKRILYTYYINKSY